MAMHSYHDSSRRKLDPRLLDVAGVHHHPTTSTECARRNVLLELAADHAIVTMGARDFAPHDAEVGAFLLSLGPIDVSDTLPAIELAVLTREHTLDLDQGGVGVAIGFAALVAKDDSSRVQAHGLLGRLFRLLRSRCLHCCRHCHVQTNRPRLESSQMAP